MLMARCMLLLLLLLLQQQDSVLPSERLLVEVF
jgi:hypothetical protein